MPPGFCLEWTVVPTPRKGGHQGGKPSRPAPPEWSHPQDGVQARRPGLLLAGAPRRRPAAHRRGTSPSLSSSGLEKAEHPPGHRAAGVLGAADRLARRESSQNTGRGLGASPGASWAKGPWGPATSPPGPPQGSEGSPTLGSCYFTAGPPAGL